MSNIAKQIEQFHKLKAEVEDELDLCMEEINRADFIQLPDNFEEMAEMQAEQIKQAQEADEIEDVLDENGQPMWH